MVQTTLHFKNNTNTNTMLYQAQQHSSLKLTTALYD